MKIISTTMILGLSAVLVACAAPSTSTQTVKAEQVVTTVKPGAAVTLESSLPKIMRTTGYNTVSLMFSESYETNNLSVQIVPSEGLSLFGGASSKSFDMAGATTHQWDVDVSAQEDGIYFLNVFAEADGQPRTFSVRLEIGDVTEDMRKSSMSENGEMHDGIRILEAQETIE